MQTAYFALKYLFICYQWQAKMYNTARCNHTEKLSFKRWKAFRFSSYSESGKNVEPRNKKFIQVEPTYMLVEGKTKFRHKQLKQVQQ